MSLLEVKGLTKRFGRRRLLHRWGEGRTVVDDVSFDVESGRTFALVGESGAGKSTTARLVLRLMEPDEGSVYLDGVDMLNLDRKALRRLRSRAQMVSQDPYGSLDPRMEIGRAVAEPLIVHTDLSRSERERRAEELLERVGIGRHLLHRHPRELSGGQLQRVSIARALAPDPALIICDEAVAALDVSIRGQVLNLLLDLQEERGIAYLFIAHDLALVEAFADDVAVMRDGKIVEQGSVGAIFGAPTELYTKELLAAIPGRTLRHRWAERDLG